MLNLKLAVLYLLISTIISGQSQYKYAYFNSDGGLPTNTIYAITEVKNGNLILEIDNGLSVFNRNNFKNLSVKNGLINPIILNICRDINQIIWLINYRGNLQKFENKLIKIQSLCYGKNQIWIRVRDINSGWSTKKININKPFLIYLQWWFVVIAVGLFMLIVYHIYNTQIKKIKKKENANSNKMIELRQNALLAMMNPHFIFNSLNAIQYFVNSNQKEKSSEHLAKLSRLVRLFLSQSSEPFISIQDEINRLKLYLELEQIRFQNFSFKFNIDGKIKLRESKIPNMVVQPFIENAILHGVSNLIENDGQITVNFVLNQNILTIEVTDNGFGILPKTQIESHISKGIDIISERLSILQKINPNKTFSLSQNIAFANTVRTGHKVIITTTI